MVPTASKGATPRLPFALAPATMIVALVVSIPPAFADDPPRDPDAQFRALRDAYQAARDAFDRANAEAKTPEAIAKLRDLPAINARNFAGGFMALARTYPGTPAAEDALLWVASHTFKFADSEEAKRVIARDFPRGAKLGPALGFQGHYSDFFEGTDGFYRAVLAANPHREVLGLANYWLARHLLTKAEGVERAKKDPGFGISRGVDQYAEVYGKDWADRLRRLDPEALRREADTLFERVAKYYGDIPHNDKNRKPGPLGEVAASYLREHRELAVGKPAPLFEGTDLDGRPFRLADTRGKVVLLDFGSHFYCGTCRLAYPRLRAMVARLDPGAFLLVSVNSEPSKVLAELKEAWTTEGNTWRCLLDGDWEGPIQKAWNIQQFPTVYLIDARGIIRGKDLPGKDLDDAIAALLAEAGK